MHVEYLEANNRNEKLTNHVIIAFDDALPSDYKAMLIKNRLVHKGDYQGFRKLFSYENSFETRDVSDAILRFIDSCGLLREGDYFSIVNYCMGSENGSWDDFVKPSESNNFYEDNGVASWISYSTVDKLFPKNQQDWQRVVYDQGRYRAQGNPFSLQTGAKHFTLKTVKSNNNRTNRVFLLIVTDDHYNGNDDVNKEIGKFTKEYNRYVSKEVFIENCREINEYYRFEYVYEKILSDAYDDNYKVMLFEVVPRFSTSINSVIDYPASFGLHRVKGGYKVDFDYKEVDPMFHVEQLVLTVKKDGEVICSKTNGRGDGNIDMELDGVYPGDDISVDISCWLSMEDPVYNGILMSPEDERCSRLNVSRKITLTDHASVFGRPLDDGMWWFHHDDSAKAALIWEVIIGVTAFFIALFIALFIAYKLLVLFSAYHPSNKKIKF